MSFLNNQISNQGMFVPEVVIYDVRTITSLDVSSSEFKLLIVRLSQSVNNISINLNKKEIGLYPLEEIVTGSLYYQLPAPHTTGLRTVFRWTYSIGAITGAGVAFNHNLPLANTWEFKVISGMANDNVGFNYYPIPMTGLTIRVNLTQVVITNTTGINFTSGSVVLEYMKTL